MIPGAPEPADDSQEIEAGGPKRPQEQSAAKEVEAGGSKRPHEQSTVSEKVRMRLNGETPAVMRHVRGELQGSCGLTDLDHSKDQDWPVDPSLKGADAYVMAMTYFYLGPKCIVFGPLLLLALFPVILVSRCRVACLPTPTFAIDRSLCGHRVYLLFVLPLSLLALIVVVLSFLLDMAAYYFFSVLFCLVTCNFKRYCRSREVLRPYRSGPSMLLAFGDVLVCLIGCSHRQGVLEATFCLTGTICVIPWYKYFVIANPFVYPLQERFITQLTTSMADISVQQAIDGTEESIVRSKLSPEMRHRVDKKWNFVPHYPWPPPWKRWAIGLQTGQKLKGCARLFLFTHSTHARADHGGSREQLVRSTSCLEPWARVILWYNNPYHFVTGWVEAQLTTGEPSQTDKARGIEHPMWIISSHSPWHCSRTASYTAGWIDEIFDGWLPEFVWALRRGARGAEAADDLYEGVVSKDGVSRPRVGKQVPQVPP